MVPIEMYRLRCKQTLKQSVEGKSGMAGKAGKGSKGGKGGKGGKGSRDFVCIAKQHLYKCKRFQLLLQI